MPSHEKKEVAPGQLDDGSFDLSDPVSDSEEAALLAEIEAATTAEAESGSEAEGGEGVDREVVDSLRKEVQEATDARMRALADFANFQRRATENEERVRDAAMTTVLRSFMPVLDHIDLALAQSEGEITVDQLMDGVRLLQSEIRKAFKKFEIDEIRPEPEDEFDPNQHQAVMRQPTDAQPTNTVVAVLQVGYRREDVVIRPATVTVAAPLEEG